MFDYLWDRPYLFVLTALWILAFFLVRRTYVGRLIYVLNVVALFGYILIVIAPHEIGEKGLLKQFSSGFDIFLTPIGWTLLLLIAAAIKRGTEKYTDKHTEIRKHNKSHHAKISAG